MRLRAIKEPLACPSSLHSPKSGRILARLAAFTILLLAAPRIAGQSIEYETMSGLIDRGAAAFASGDYAQAASAFGKLESVYSQEPEWEQSQLGEKIMPLAGYAALKAGLYDQAIASLQQFINQDSSAYSPEIFVKYTLALAHKKKGDFEKALDAFAQFRESTHSVSQQSIALIHEANVFVELGNEQQAITILSEVSDGDAATRIRAHARLRLLQIQLEQGLVEQASVTLLARPWLSDDMPELAMLAFLAIEAGDAFLANELPDEARQAYRLAPSRAGLIDQQNRKVHELTSVFNERRKEVGMGGIMWTDFYESLIATAAAQLEALENSEDYTAALRLRRGKASLLSQRPYEAWLLFERLSGEAEDDVREAAHFNWILAAKELDRFEEAISIAKQYLQIFPDSGLADQTLSLIAHTLIDARRYDDAIAALGELVSKASDRDLRTASLYDRGHCFLRIRNYDAAQSDFDDVIHMAASAQLVEKAELWKGISHMLQDDVDTASTLFAALATKATIAQIGGEAHYRHACCLYSSFEYDACIESLAAFAQKYQGHPRQYEAQLLLGDAYFAIDDTVNALTQYRAIPGGIPEISHLAAIQSVNALATIGQNNTALRIIESRSSATVDPYKFTELQLLAADIHSKDGNRFEARRALLQAIDIHGDSDAAENMSETLEFLNDIEEVDPETSRKSALEAGKFRLAGRYWLLQSSRLSSAGREFESQESLLALANEIPIHELPPECLAQAGLALVKLELEEGAAMLERLLSEYPESAYAPFAFYGQALKEAQAGQHSAALGWLDRIDSGAYHSPIFVDRKLLEGRARMALDEFVPAQEAFDSVLSYRWATSQQKADSLLALAELKGLQGEAAQAVAYCQRVFTLYPGVTEAAALSYYRGARYLAKLSMPEKAREVLSEFLSRPEYQHTEPFEQAKSLIKTLEPQRKS